MGKYINILHQLNNKRNYKRLINELENNTLERQKDMFLSCNYKLNKIFKIPIGILKT